MIFWLLTAELLGFHYVKYSEPNFLRTKACQKMFLPKRLELKTLQILEVSSRLMISFVCVSKVTVYPSWKMDFFTLFYFKMREVAGWTDCTSIWSISWGLSHVSSPISKSYETFRVCRPYLPKTFHKSSFSNFINKYGHIKDDIL